MTGLGFKKSVGLGVPLGRVVAELNVIIPFAPITEGSQVDGTPRSFCKSENGLNTLELVGDLTVTESVSLITSMTDDPIANVQNSALMVRLLQVLVPQWQDQHRWLTAASSSKGTKRTSKHGIVISLSRPRDGVLILSVR